MDRYILTAWGRKIFIILIVIVALIWGIRQASQTYQIWFPIKSADNQPTKIWSPIPEAAKAVGEQFIWEYYTTKKDESLEQKRQRMNNWVTSHIQSKWISTPLLISLSQHFEPNKVIHWDGRWLEAGKKAYMEYQLVLENEQKMRLRLLVVKSGTTWSVDSLPSLLPQPVQGAESKRMTAFIKDSEKRKVEQTLDGFFDSWLKGRVDGNTKTLKKPLTNLLKPIKGVYRAVAIERIQEKPLVINATVFIGIQRNDDTSNDFIVPFQYQIELEESKGQYLVKKIIGD